MKVFEIRGFQRLSCEDRPGTLVLNNISHKLLTATLSLEVEGLGLLACFSFGGSISDGGLKLLSLVLLSCALEYRTAASNKSSSLSIFK